MNPKLLIMSLLCSACTINGQGKDSTKSNAKISPKPTASFASTSRLSGTQADREISVGNIKIVYNDELRKLSSRYLITQNEIKQMLERYAEGGTATITKIINLYFEKYISERPKGPLTQAQLMERILVGNLQIVYSDELRTLMRDFLITPTQMLNMLERYAKGGAATMTQRIILYLKKFISKSPITSVSATTDSFLGVASMTIDSMPEPVDPLYLDRLLSKVVYLQKQIKLLDKERDALNNFYRNGYITIQTRNENLMRNRIHRSVFEYDLLVLQMKIRRMPGSEYMEPAVVPRENNGDDEKSFES